MNSVGWIYILFSQNIRRGHINPITLNLISAAFNLILHLFFMYCFGWWVAKEQRKVHFPFSFFLSIFLIVEPELISIKMVQFEQQLCWIETLVTFIYYRKDFLENFQMPISHIKPLHNTGYIKKSNKMLVLMVFCIFWCIVDWISNDINLIKRFFI